jgi:hypothetical protein
MLTTMATQNSKFSGSHVLIAKLLLLQTSGQHYLSNEWLYTSIGAPVHQFYI